MVKGASSHIRSKTVMVAAMSNAAQKGNNHASTAMTHTGIMTVVSHCAALHNNEKLHKTKIMSSKPAMFQTEVAPAWSLMT